VIRLARSRLPLTITPGGHESPQEDWRVVAPAFLARISRTSITVDRERRFSFSLRAGVGLNGTAVFRSANKIRSSIRTRRKQPVTLARKSFRAPASGKVRLKIHAVAPELSHPQAQPKDPHTGDRHAAQRRWAEQHGEQTDHPRGAQTTRSSPEAPRLHDR
jgi:hypothetical protein